MRRRAGVSSDMGLEHTWEHIGLGSCDLLPRVLVLTWANGRTVSPSGSTASAVMPRCSLFDLVCSCCGSGAMFDCSVWPSTTALAPFSACRRSAFSTAHQLGDLDKSSKAPSRTPLLLLEDPMEGQDFHTNQYLASRLLHPNSHRLA